MPMDDCETGTGPGITASGVSNSCCSPAPPKRKRPDLSERNCLRALLPRSVDDALLAAHLSGRSQQRLADDFGVDRGVVKLRLRQLGAPLGGNRWRQMKVPHDLDGQMLSEYADGRSQSRIARDLGLNRGTVRDRLRRLGVPPDIRFQRARKPLNHAAFAEVTPESAYWAGFLMADGCVHRPQQGQARIGVDLAVRDRDHLEKLRIFLGSGRTISMVHQGPRTVRGRFLAGTTAALFTVCSNSIADDLARFGIVPNKTHRERVVGLEVDRDFWRGCVDGDGSIHYSRSGRYVYPQLDLVGSRSLLEQFAAYIHTLVPKYEGHPGAFRHSPSTFIVGTSGRTTVAVVRALYSGAVVALDRKRTLAEGVLRWATGRESSPPVAHL